MMSRLLRLGLFGALSLFAVSFASGCAKKPAKPKAPRPADTQVVEVALVNNHFVATPATVKLGHPVTLVVTRKNDKNCASEIVVKSYGITEELPVNTPVEVTFTPKQAGKVEFACAMDMIKGELDVE